jgi:hypothetical protein
MQFGFWSHWRSSSPKIVLAALWLMGRKVVAVFAASHWQRLHRIGGAVLIGLYLILAGAIVAWK